MKTTPPFSRTGLGRGAGLSLLLSSLLLSSSALGVSESYGKPLRGLTSVPLAKILENPKNYGGKTIRTEGPVAAVCTQKGCWMTLGQGTKTIRVTFKDYGFFVPKDIAGATAVVEGLFEVKTVHEATAKHYAGETPGGKPDEIKGDQEELSFVATGVELTRKK